uniref:Uncharacterized protein n=1 Tax=Meloidogyne enterolobii TaxID=390850 RepID=A0A6V7UQE2_MELEN|nr:unnamed protein product [Meloidogyne enterolobii]
MSIPPPPPQNTSNTNLNSINVNPPIELLVDELYKCAHPPPSYSKATRNNNNLSTIRRALSENQPRELTFISPFGGSLCRIFPSLSTTNNPPTEESPPIYTRNVSEIDTREFNSNNTNYCCRTFQFLHFQSPNKKRFFSGFICFLFILIIISLFVILDRLLLD